MIKAPDVTQTREWGAGCDTGGGALGNFSLEGVSGLDNFFLKVNLEPKGLKGRSIPSYGKNKRDYE